MKTAVGNTPWPEIKLVKREHYRVLGDILKQLVKWGNGAEFRGLLYNLSEILSDATSIDRFFWLVSKNRQTRLFAVSGNVFPV